MKTVAIIIARMGSTRLPGKVLRKLNKTPVLEWVVKGAWDASIDDLWIATTIEERDNAIEEWCYSAQTACYRGSETDVLSRVYHCAKVAGADIIVRITGDCPFLDSNVINQVIRLRQTTGVDYASNVDPPTYADGLDCEALTFKSLEAAYNEATRTSDRDCVTRYIARNRDRFPAATLINPIPGGHKERFVLDTENDLKFCQQIAKRLPKKWSRSHLDILRILDAEPDLREINAHHPRNERFYEQVAIEERPKPKFDRSIRALQRAREGIPLGAQTFSKSYLQYPKDAAPLFLTHGDGGYVFDVDGNDYVDLVCGLLPVILGYRDPDVDEAIRRQLSNGISFSTSTTLEADLADLLISIIPCAEMVRYGKNGSDVTACAVRLARAFTGRDLVLLSGYHGWHDWSIGTTERNKGIPEHPSIAFPFGDRERVVSLCATHGYPAAIIVEPHYDRPFLCWLREFCDSHGIVLIFDEIISGFRWSLGGAQEAWKVTPDLATFGKAMGNGMPINAIVGRKNIMKLCEPPDNIFYSGTFQGETLSISAAIACISKLQKEQIPQSLADKGQLLIRTVGDHPSCVSIGGHRSRPSLAFFDRDGATADQIKTVFIREMINQGVLIINGFNLCHAHREPELKRVVKAFEHTIGVIKDGLNGNFADVLGDTPVIGQTSVRSWGAKVA